MKHTMELVWHSCTDCLPSENYNSNLYITNGYTVFPASWYRNGSQKMFAWGNDYIYPGVNSDGYWWADLVKTVRGFAPLQTRV